jgi:hypothetical protein
MYQLKSDLIRTIAQEIDNQIMNGPPEPVSVIFIGGPAHGKKMILSEQVRQIIIPTRPKAYTSFIDDDTGVFKSGGSISFDKFVYKWTGKLSACGGYYMMVPYE